jgi:penicillin-binding protein 1A
LRDLIPEPWKASLKRLALGFDAWIDFSLFRSFKGAREGYERFATFMDRFHVSGWRRLLNELVSEGATLATAGAILTLALAIPAFQETSDDDWLKKSELAVTFLDRYGNEIGTRGIRHNDSIPLDQFPDHLIKAVLATEDRRFYEHFGIDIPGTMRALTANARAYLQTEQFPGSRRIQKQIFPKLQCKFSHYVS